MSAALTTSRYGKPVYSAIRNAPGPHDRGKDLTPCTRCRLDTAGLLWTVADSFHERNGERSASHDVGDGTTRHGPHGGGGENRRFRGPSPLSSGERVREVDEELARTCDFKERSEQNEDEDKGGGYAQGDPVYPLLAQIELSDEPCGAIPSMPKNARECGARIPVTNEAGGDERNRPP